MRVARILKSGALTRRLCSTIGQSDSVLIIREHSQPRGPGLWQHSRTFATTWSRSVTTFENIRVITWSSFGGKSQLRASLSSFASLVYSIESKYFIEWKILNRIKIKPISHRYILSLIARKKNRTTKDFVCNVENNNRMNIWTMNIKIHWIEQINEKIKWIWNLSNFATNGQP